MKEDVELFTYTQSANFGDRIVWCSSLDYGPIDGIWGIFSFELPDIIAQSCPTPLLILSVDVSIVLCYPGLQWVIG